MSSLPTRVISAAVAILLILGIHWQFGVTGLLLLGAVVCTVGVYEFQKIAFSHLNVSRSLRWLFAGGAVVLLARSIEPNELTLVWWSLIFASFIVITIGNERKKATLENEKLVAVMATASMGWLYCGLLPSFALRLLLLEKGLAWFGLLLTLVFAGDVFAYFGGYFFGKNKLMPSLSPNKTVEGAVAGAIGSVIAGCLVAHFWLPEVSLLVVGVAALAAAIIAQAGDLFESLVKRVAGVKDSGKIMPGHGGVLDRLDGVYFAAPLVYAISHWSI
jgi:phosphatidate cytidylyltransferase